MKIRGFETYFRICAALLALLSLAKMGEILRGEKALFHWDPLLPFLTIRESGMLAALFEIMVAIILVTSRSVATKAWLMAMLSSLLLSYRASYVLFDIKLPCQCLGVLRHWLHLSPATNDIVAIGLLAFLAIGGYYVFWQTVVRQQMQTGTGDSRVAIRTG